MPVKFNPKSVFSFVVLVGSFFSILPFWVLSAFNQPSADDFVYAVTYLKDGFFTAQYNWYVGWSGRYVASALLSLSPVSFHSFTGYKLQSFLLILLLLYALYYTVGHLFEKESKRHRLTISMFVLFIYLYQMPKIVSGFYWGAGAITYQLGNVFFLFMSGSIVAYLKRKDKKYAITSFIALFLLTGSNETLMLLSDILLFISAFFFYIYGKKFRISRLRKQPYLALLLFAAIVFSLFVVLAPGNDVRLGLLPNSHKLSAFHDTLLSAQKFVAQWILPVGVFSILMLGLLRKSDIAQNALFILHPLWAFLIVLVVTYAGFFPAHWSMGVPPPARTVNTIYFFFILTWLYFIVSLYHYYKGIDMPGYTYYLLTLAMIGFFFFPNNIQTAYRDWLHGDARAYNAQFNTRYTRIKQQTTVPQNKDTIRVLPLKIMPKTLYFNDLSVKPKDWRNKAYATYFKVPFIVVKKQK